MSEDEAIKNKVEIDKELLKKAGFEQEKLEVRREILWPTDYPQSARTYRIEFEAENANVEEMYFWLVGHAHYDWGFHELHKIVDTHASSVGSSTFGDLQARLGAQQSNVSNYMGMMGKLLKDLFALVRELRQIEERLRYYAQSYDEKSSERRTSEATLKDIWITLVEGGTQSPGSVYGMAREVGFTVLPDLFFQAPPMETAAIEKYVDGLDFNNSVKMALKRKLNQFTIWKEETYKELKNKKMFQIKYLGQHFEVIMMYMQWIKPYLKQIKRLNMNSKGMDDPLLVNSFDTSQSQIEIIATKPAKEFGDPQPCILFSFDFHTRPQLQFHAKESWNQKGAIHVGRTNMTMRCYGWTPEEIQKYKTYREQESLDILMNFDQSVKDAMEHLGDDLKKYLTEAKATNKDLFAEKPRKEEKKKEEKLGESTTDVVLAPFKGLQELFSPLIPTDLFSSGFTTLFGDAQAKKKKEADDALKAAKKEAAGAAVFTAYQCYKNNKKAHRMVHW